MAKKNSMDSFEKKGVDIGNELDKGKKDIQDMGKDFQRVKDQVSGMPEGLDPDLAKSIDNFVKTAKEEVKRDIENTESSVIDKAKNAADDLTTDVDDKISDNNTAKGKLEGIDSKYGKQAASDAKSAIEANTKRGQDLIKDMKKKIGDTDTGVKAVKDSL